jgi:hypothetical protein
MPKTSEMSRMFTLEDHQEDSATIPDDPIKHAERTLKLLLKYGIEHPDTTPYMERYTSKFKDNIQAIMYILHQINEHISESQDYTYELCHVIKIIADAMSTPRYPTHYDYDTFTDLVRKEFLNTCIAALGVELDVYISQPSKKKHTLQRMHRQYMRLYRACQSIGIRFHAGDNSGRRVIVRDDLSTKARAMWLTAADEIRATGKYQIRTPFSDTFLELRLGRAMPCKLVSVPEYNRILIPCAIDRKCKLLESISDSKHFDDMKTGLIARIIQYTKMPEAELTQCRLDELRTALSDLSDFAHPMNITLSILNSLRRLEGDMLNSPSAIIIKTWLNITLAVYANEIAFGLGKYNEALVKLFLEKYVNLWGESPPLNDLIHQAEVMCTNLNKQYSLGKVLCTVLQKLGQDKHVAGFNMEDYLTFHEEHEFNFLSDDYPTDFSTPIRIPVEKPKTTYLQYKHRVETLRYNSNRYAGCLRDIVMQIRVTKDFSKLIQSMPASLMRKW